MVVITWEGKKAASILICSAGTSFPWPHEDSDLVVSDGARFLCFKSEERADAGARFCLFVKRLVRSFLRHWPVYSSLAMLVELIEKLLGYSKEDLIATL
jgi:hypothetical protein